MWDATVESLDTDYSQKVEIWSHGKRMLYSEVVEQWQDSEPFRAFFISLLASTPFSAFFWETPAVTEATIYRPFEFVVVNSPELAMVSPDAHSFERYFHPPDQTDGIVAFPNLSNDAWLVVPCPHTTASAYPHLAAFIREAPAAQIHALWQRVGLALEQRLHQHPLWLSTSGLGVHWLHIRLDSHPKYYSFHPYKHPLYQTHG